MTEVEMETVRAGRWCLSEVASAGVDAVAAELLADAGPRAGWSAFDRDFVARCLYPGRGAAPAYDGEAAASFLVAEHAAAIDAGARVYAACVAGDLLARCELENGDAEAVAKLARVYAAARGHLERHAPGAFRAIPRGVPPIVELAERRAHAGRAETNGNGHGDGADGADGAERARRNGSDERSTEHGVERGTVRAAERVAERAAAEALASETRPTPPVRVRTATPADAPALSVLLAEAVGERLATSWQLGTAPRAPELAAHLAELARDPRVRLLVAERDTASPVAERDTPIAERDDRCPVAERDAGVPVAERDAGLVGLLDFRRHAHPQRAGGRVSLFVGAAERRRGVGRALLDALCAWADDEGVERLEAAVFATNSAGRALFEDRGFVEEGRRPGAVRVAGEPVDLLELART